MRKEDEERLVYLEKEATILQSKADRLRDDLISIETQLDEIDDEIDLIKTRL